MINNENVDAEELQRLSDECCELVAQFPINPVMSSEDQFEQMVSYVFGNLMDSTPEVTEEQIRHVLTTQFG